MIISKGLEQLTDKILSGDVVDKDDARFLLAVDLDELLPAANHLRKHFKGNKVGFCSIINARSGNCSQDCKFCAQSAHYNTGIQEYPFIEPQQAKEGAEKAIGMQANHYGIVVSGRGIKSKKDIDQVCRLLEIVPKERITACASLGELTPGFATRLKEMGVSRYHHNLETSERFFPQICTTHSYEDRVKTLQIAAYAGFETCSGGIFGLGEDWEDRLDMAFALRELGVSSVPLNFLVPIPGTPMANNKPLSAGEILRIIAVYRFILPEKDIKVAGGREANLRDLQSWIFLAGANEMMIGNYLTVKGRPVDQDWQMVADLGLTVDAGLS
ncbi:MAG: biotin synthase BioB [Candidatus Schekmanbacteria bacterium]|nr:biotin synthase BioB [Candidatus Schekmanbacteria bacterium]